MRWATPHCPRRRLSASKTLLWKRDEVWGHKRVEWDSVQVWGKSELRVKWRWRRRLFCNSKKSCDSFHRIYDECRNLKIWVENRYTWVLYWFYMYSEAAQGQTKLTTSKNASHCLYFVRSSVIYATYDSSVFRQNKEENSLSFCLSLLFACDAREGRKRKWTQPEFPLSLAIWLIRGNTIPWRDSNNTSHRSH